jgi:hypothetical protein
MSNLNPLITFNNRPSNLLDPVHVFSCLGGQKGETDYDQIANEIVEFVAACLNERSNGTIHICVDPKFTDFQIEGEIQGFRFDMNHCLQSLF